MSWIKDVLVDIIVAMFIIVGVWTGAAWMKWVIIGYTAILALAKIVVIAGDNSLQLIRKTKISAPDWVLHLLYGLNTAVLLYAKWWYAAGGWILIWLFSYLAQRKLSARTGGQAEN